MTQAVFKRPISVDIVYNIVASIKSFDDLEVEHITDTLSWIDIGMTAHPPNILKTVSSISQLFELLLTI